MYASKGVCIINRMAILEIERVVAETAALRNDHALSTLFPVQ